jgi:hypothetical protein
VIGTQIEFEALTTQMATLSGHRGRRHQPSLLVSEEEDKQGDEEETGNPFVGCRAHGHQPVQAHVNRWESSFKLEIPEFQGCLQPEEFMDWIVAVGEILDFKGVLEDHNQILGKSSGTVATIEVIKCVAWKRKD